MTLQHSFSRVAMFEGLKIVALSLAAAVCYGILHDNVTARVCVEYFTKFHPYINWVGSSPTALALYWGIAATWWMGAGLGIPLAFFARWGRPPKVAAGQLIMPFARLLMVMACCSAVMGLLAFGLAKAGWIDPPGPWSVWIARERQPRFLADLWAHNSAYVVGFLGGVGLWGWCVRSRRTACRTSESPGGVVSE